MGEIKPITLKIEEKLWKKFKEKTSRTITLNDAIINLIEKDVSKFYISQKEVKTKDE